MKYRKHVLVSCGVIAAGALIMYAFCELRHFAWEEDAFNGSLLTELQSTFVKQGRELVPVDAATLYAITNRRLKPNQHAVRFLKGKEYGWCSFGTVINVGYVVVQKDGDEERIVAIIHARSVNSL